ncbi:MAG: serine/threonine-protein kinase, partial [Gemmatimonadaceae bacterium]
VEGESLRQVIRQRGPLSPLGAAEVITQVCAALDEAHRQGVIHRDIKPDNIMVHSAIGGLRVKVLDFGSVKDKNKDAKKLTVLGTTIGSPYYMAPEQVQGQRGDARSDVYSLAVMMFEMLTSRPPFFSEAPGDLIAMHMLQPPPALRDFIPDIDPILERLIEAMLSKDPQVRPLMADVAQQLK